MSPTDHMPLPLLHKISHGSALALRAHPGALAQALQRIAQGFVGLEKGADLLRTQASGMLTEQSDNALTQLAPWSAHLPQRWHLFSELCISNVTGCISTIIVHISSVTVRISNRQAQCL